MTIADILEEKIKAFVPHCITPENERLELTLLGLSQIPGALSKLVKNPIYPVDVDDLTFDSANAEKLKTLFDKYGSDKARSNTYHKFYSSIIDETTSNIFEIGLGTNNPSIPSNMGTGGRPGASLRAFKEFLPNCRIYGADIDSLILFQEERIQTRQVNQLSQESLASLRSWLPPLDLFIDDGFHSFAANLNSLVMGIQLTKPGGWIVIEDIKESTFPLWKVVADLCVENNSLLIRAGTGRIFAMQMTVES